MIPIFCFNIASLLQPESAYRNKQLTRKDQPKQFPLTVIRSKEISDQYFFPRSRSPFHASASSGLKANTSRYLRSDSPTLPRRAYAVATLSRQSFLRRR